jgi:hypothetical protein
VRWFEWMAAEIPWQPGTVVEVGCGPGYFWDEDARRSTGVWC